MTTRRFSDATDEALDGFYGEVASADLQPLWTQHTLMPKQPPLAAVPWRWPGEVCLDLVRRSGTLVPVHRGGDRRVLGFANPGLGGEPFATPTLWAALQYLEPGEHAPAHRHSPAALRFVLEGRGTWTAVNGEPVAMEPGDLVLTPSWCWHEHVNVGSDPMVWFDGLDIPLARSLDAVFFETGGDERPRAGEGPSRSEQTFALAAGLVPADDTPTAHTAHTPLMRYPWAGTDHALDSLLARPGGDGWARLRYVDPTTGRDVMPTMRCEMLRVEAGRASARRQTTGSYVYCVFAGGGTVELGDQTLPFAVGDVIAVPSWIPHRFQADRRADIFVLTDTPVIEALGLYRAG